MNPTQFQLAHSGDLKLFFESPLGKNFLGALHSLRPSYEFPVHEHLMMANREAIRGYELCLRNIVGLTLLPKPREDIQADYGVKEPKIVKEEGK